MLKWSSDHRIHHRKLDTDDDPYSITKGFWHAHIGWIIENKDALIGIITGVVALASAIAALTPTPKDDGWVKKAYKVIDLLALNVGKAKDK